MKENKEIWNLGIKKKRTSRAYASRAKKKTLFAKFMPSFGSTFQNMSDI